ncbi:Acyl--CoA ligase OS=Streptomyces microflavus OX=1919 GN=G3I39_20660 PE=3 SV=1 [Streptomyces microflavus]
MPLTSTTLLSPEARLRLAELPGLGGGNAWRIAAETNPAADRPVLLADLPLAGLDGTPRTEFSLRDLDALADAWSAWYLDRAGRATGCRSTWPTPSRTRCI